LNPWRGSGRPSRTAADQGERAARLSDRILERPIFHPVTAEDYAAEVARD
jgi:hypothetical protein